MLDGYFAFLPEDFKNAYQTFRFPDMVNEPFPLKYHLGCRSPVLWFLGRT